jgi:hypothetical protein
MKHYAYFFTRQDISPEQQVVQTAHAAFQLGVNSQRWIDNPPANQQVHADVKAEETYFAVVGVRNLDGLNAVQKILDKFHIKYEVFFEPDLNNGENTSIAVYPIQEDKRDILLAFKLLSIGRR